MLNQKTSPFQIFSILKIYCKFVVNGKRIYIPNNIQYTLPATEKQFTDNLPSGSWVSVPKDIIFGIHWEDVNNNRIDLDLSLINCEHGKIGWDCSYRTDTGDVLFSGDMTDAPGDNGASELFYIQRQKAGSYILLVNYYEKEIKALEKRKNDRELKRDKKILKII